MGGGDCKAARLQSRRDAVTTAKPRDRDIMLNMLIKLFINSICSFIASLTTEKPLDLNPLYSSSIHQSSIFTSADAIGSRPPSGPVMRRCQPLVV